MKNKAGDDVTSLQHPPKQPSPLINGTACVATNADHAITASHGWQGTSGNDYRATQAPMMATGNLSGAFQLDVLDLQSKSLAAKYAGAITQARA